MGAKKKRTTEQYEKWLSQPFNSTFGISFDDWANQVSKRGGWTTKNNAYGTNIAWWRDTGKKMCEDALGEGAWLMVMGIVAEEGGGTKYGWINHTNRSSNPVTALRDDLAKIKEQLNSTSYPAATTAPEVPGSMSASGVAECNAALKRMPIGSIGRYYMTMTLAGNACVYSEAWANTTYFGNPYDDIMDMIEACGGDPYDGQAPATGGSGSGGATDMSSFMDMLSSALAQGVDAFKKFLDEMFPKAVYLNNSKFSVLGVKFRRYQQYLYLTYPWQNFTGSGGDGEGGDPSQNPSDWYQKMITELDKVRNKKFEYQNYRPQGDLLSVDYADCSGFAGWIARTAFPDLWRGGSTNTANQKASFDNGSIGKVVIEGSQSYVASRVSEIKAGDFLLMGQTSACGAGLASHVAWVETPDKVWSMEGAGLLCYSASYFLNTWWTSKPYMSVCRPS